MATNVSGIVLAGGRSSRFGSDKLAAMVAGRTLLEHAIDAVATVAGEVIVVIASDGPAPELPRVMIGVEVRLVRDTASFAGPLAGLLNGVRIARHPVLIVVAGDMPQLVPAVLRLQIDALVAADGVDAIALGSDAASGAATSSDRYPLPLALLREPAALCAQRLLRSGVRSLRALLSGIDTAVIPAAAWRVADPDGSTVRDIDRVEDLPRPE